MPEKKKRTVVPRLRFPEFRNAGPWEVKRLGEVSEINPTCGPLPERFIYIDLESVVDGRLIQRREISRASAPSRAQRVIERGDILFQMVRPYQRNNLFFDYNDGNYVASTGYAQLRASQNARFLYQVLHTDSFVGAVLARCSGSNYPAINPSDLSSIQIGFPPEPEQQKIADCLSSLDELIQLEAQKLDALKAHKKGLMQQLFPREGETTPRLRFPQFRNAGPWEKHSLADLENNGWVELGRGQVISQIDIKEHPGPYPVYSSSTKNDGLMGKYGRFMFDEELITWSIDGGGDFFYRPKHKFSVTNVCGYLWVDTSTLNTRFIASQLQSRHASLTFDYQFKAHPSVIRKLYTLSLPSLPEQQKIADCLSSLDELIQLEAQKLNALKAHKKGLLQQLFPQEVSA